MSVAALAALVVLAGEGSRPEPTVTAVAKGPLLLFEIDEGFPNGMLGRFRQDPAGLVRSLSYVCTALAPLRKQYDVAVLVYPCQAYLPAAEAHKEQGKLARVDPALLKMLDFLGKNKIGVFLEVLSSGIANTQSNRQGTRPTPLLGMGSDDHERLGLSMDLPTFDALAERYPSAFRGIRFHEIYGSDVNWKSSPANDRQGFHVDPEVIRACFDLCAKRNLRLIWSDSSWLLADPIMKDQPHYVGTLHRPPYFMGEPQKTLQDEAERRLGSNLCFSMANNNYHFTPNLDFLDCKIGPSTTDVARKIPIWLQFDQPFTTFPLKNRTKSVWGLSVQSWFWHELSYTLTGHYYTLGELACPVEIMAAYVRKGLAEGASILQFEPGSYFFNEPLPGRTDYAAAFEQRADHSEKLAFKRLKSLLLSPAALETIPARLDTMFDRNQQRFHENDISNPPRNFAQSTLGIAWAQPGPEPVKTAFYDFYSYGPRWLRQDAYRLGDWLFRPTPPVMTRVEIDGDGVDELLVARPQPDGTISLRFFNQGSASLGELSVPARTAEGDVMAITSANLIQEIAGAGDPDEVVICRRPQGGKGLNLQVYKLSWVANEFQKLQMTPLSADENTAVLNRFVDLPGVRSRAVAVVGLRNDAGLTPKGWRSLDRLLVIGQDDRGFVARVRKEGVEATSLLTSSPAPTVTPAVCAIDDQFGGRDSLCLSWPADGGFQVAIFRVDGANLSLSETQRLSAGIDAHSRPMLFSLRRRILLNKGEPK